MEERAEIPPARRLWDRIEAERNERGWTLLELVERSGVPRSTVYRWKTAKRPPLAESINPIADALGIPRRELLALAGLSPLEPSGPAAELQSPAPSPPSISSVDVGSDVETENLLAKLSPRRRRMLEEFRESERARLERIAEDATREAQEANDRFVRLVRVEADESGISGS